MTLSPTSTGTLQAQPLHRLLMAALEHQWSGTLVLEAAGGKKSALLLSGGRLVKVKTAERVSALGAMCVQLGFIADAKLQELLAQPRTGLLGEALVGRGLLSSEQLEVALCQQLLGQVGWLALLPRSTVYGLYEGQDFLARWGGPPRSVDPLAVIWRALRAVDLDQSGLLRILPLLEGQPLRLHPEARVARFGFDAKERSVVDVLRAKPQLLTQLIGLGMVPALTVQRVVGVLALTQHLDVGGGRGPLDVQLSSQVAPAERPRDLLRRARTSTPPVTPLPAAVAAAEPTEELLARRVEIEGSTQRLQKQDFYELLGLARDATPAVVHAAFLQQAKRWHPDRLESELADLKPLVNKVFARMTEAHQVLTDSARRAEYDRAVKEDASEQEQEEVHRALAAAAAFQKAQILVRRSEWDEALSLAEKAQQDDPEQAEYIALVAWLEARKLQGAAPEAFQSVLDRLTRASKIQPKNLRVRMYRAEVLKAAGRHNDALREYRYIAEADPNNVEAQRELRLHKMRAASSTSSEHSIFGKLFKKS